MDKKNFEVLPSLDVIVKPSIQKVSTDQWSSSNHSSRLLHDVGYSSGENSVYEALNSLGRYYLLLIYTWKRIF